MIFEEVKQPFSRKQFNLPRLREGQALIEIEYATVCASDLHTYFGRRESPHPGILGHEILGRVAEVGPGGLTDYYGRQVEEGARVTWSVYAHDHQGEMARRGLPQKSADLFKYGHEPLNGYPILSGGFATHCHLREGTDIFRIPEELDPREAAPLNCTHATIAGALRLAGNLNRKNVLVIGSGMLGLSACAMSRERGASHVWTMDIHSERAEKALSFGAEYALRPGAPITDLKAFPESKGGVDIVIETSGMPDAMEAGLKWLNTGGTAIWVGAVFTQRDLNLNAEWVVRKLLTIKGLHNYIPADLEEAVRFMSEHRLSYPFHSLVGEEFALDDLDQAFAAGNSGKYYRIGIHPTSNIKKSRP
jgi:putative phosphonate catabolism associated alcohol dehydrogenase